MKSPIKELNETSNVSMAAWLIGPIEIIGLQLLYFILPRTDYEFNQFWSTVLLTVLSIGVVVSVVLTIIEFRYSTKNRYGRRRAIAGVILSILALVSGIGFVTSYIK